MARISIDDIAKAANVSTATVDRVLNRRGGVSLEKERRVLEQARRLGADRDLERTPGRILRFAVLMQHPSNPFYEALEKSFRYARSLYQQANIQISLHYFDGSQGVSEQTLQDVSKLATRIARQHDAILVAVPNEPQLTRTLDDIAKRLPMVVLSSDLPIADKLAYVGIDNLAAGRTAGELMGRFIGHSGGDILVIAGMHSYVSQGEREMGFRSVLASRYPHCRIHAVVETRENPQQAGQLLNQALQQQPLLAGVYNLSTGDLSIARILAHHQHQHRNKPLLISHELTPERRQLLQEGVIDAVIDQNPEKQALSALAILARHFAREGERALGIKPEITVYLRENCPA